MSDIVDNSINTIRNYITLLELRLEYEKYSNQLDLSEHFEAIFSNIWTTRTWATRDILRTENGRLSFTIMKENHKYKLFHHYDRLVADSKYLYDLLRDYPLDKLIEINREQRSNEQIHRR